MNTHEGNGNPNIIFHFQLTCVGGSAAGAFVPQVVQCTNMGSDGYDVQVKFYI